MEVQIERDFAAPVSGGAYKITTVPGASNEATARARRLSENQEWNAIDRELPNAGHVTLTPGNESLARLLGAQYFEGFGNTGVASEVVKTALSDFPARVPNLWHTAYESPDGLLSLEYLRSGTVARYGERDTETRLAATAAGARELLHAALAVAEKRGTRGTLRVVTIDLQTPNGKEGELEVERETVPEQAQALKEAAKGRITLGGEPAAIQLTSLLFPTHEGSFTRKEEWKLNEETLKAARQIALSPLDGFPAHLRESLAEVTRETLMLLSKERENESSPPERFALAARLVLLSALQGDVVHFNCRSGKDRTGFLDVEVKFLAFQVARRALGLEVSGPAEKVQPDEAAAWKEILLEGGNVDVQRLNTGFPGSKLDRGFLLERVGPALWKEFVGESRKSRS